MGPTSKYCENNAVLQKLLFKHGHCCVIRQVVILCSKVTSFASKCHFVCDGTAQKFEES